jgi:hypothetical protein
VRVHPTPCVRELLAALYPTIRWDVVSFHEGLPAGVRRFTNVGITLPAPFGTRGIRIYVADGRWDPCTPKGLALLVHEAFHVLQFQESWGGVGLGPVRGFAVKYLFRATFEGGGVKNLYEAPAYAQEKAFAAACKALPRPLCDCSALGGGTDREMLDQLLRLHPSLVRRSAKPG